MKKFIKNNIIGFILGAIIFGSVGVVASNIMASSVTYDNSISRLKDSDNQDVTTVQGAIDSLYTIANESLMDRADLSIKETYMNRNSATSTGSMSLTNLSGNYIAVYSVTEAGAAQGNLNVYNNDMTLPYDTASKFTATNGSCELLSNKTAQKNAGNAYADGWKYASSHNLKIYKCSFTENGKIEVKYAEATLWSEALTYMLRTIKID